MHHKRQMIASGGYAFGAQNALNGVKALFFGVGVEIVPIDNSGDSCLRVSVWICGQ
jgi:hypothetical protein